MRKNIIMSNAIIPVVYAYREKQPQLMVKAFQWFPDMAIDEVLEVGGGKYLMKLRVGAFAIIRPGNYICEDRNGIKFVMSERKFNLKYERF